MLSLTSYILVFVLGGLTSYLVLRNNPKIKALVDALTDKVAGIFKKK